MTPAGQISMDIDLPDGGRFAYPNGTAARRLTQIGCTVEVGVSETGTVSSS